MTDLANSILYYGAIIGVAVVVAYVGIMLFGVVMVVLMLYRSGHEQKTGKYLWIKPVDQLEAEMKENKVSLFFRMLYRYQLGSQFVQMAMFCMIAFSTGKQVGLNGWTALLIAIPTGVIGVLITGFIIDRFGKQQTHMERINFERSPIAQDYIRKINEIHSALIPTAQVSSTGKPVVPSSETDGKAS